MEKFQKEEHDEKKNEGKFKQRDIIYLFFNEDPTRQESVSNVVHYYIVSNLLVANI